MKQDQVLRAKEIIIYTRGRRGKWASSRAKGLADWIQQRKTYISEESKTKVSAKLERESDAKQKKDHFWQSRCGANAQAGQSSQSGA